MGPKKNLERYRNNNEITINLKNILKITADIYFRIINKPFNFLGQIYFENIPFD